MASHNVVFTPGYPPYDEEGPFQENPFARPEDSLVDPSKFIDPILQSSSPSSAPYPPKCDLPPQPVQRYLNDHQITAFFNADLPPKMLPNRAHRRTAAGITPVHAPSHARFSSPTSSHEPSSTGSVLSPPGDTESYYDNNFPATPPDTALLTSPYMHPAVTHYEYLNQQSLLHFTNMGPSQTNAYVNPIDVQQSQNRDNLYENEASNFDLNPQGSFSDYEAYGTSPCFNLDPAAQRQEVTRSEPFTRLSSPEDNQTTVKEEIQASYHYPHPSQHVEEPEDRSEDEEPAPERTSKRRKAEEDSDYSPTIKKTRSNTIGSAAGKSPAKRRTMNTNQAAPSRSPDASPSKKKPRTVAPNATIPASTRATPSGPGLFPCSHCKQSHFKDQASLDNHVKKQHTRPYHCVFHFAGCTSTFATKNEWKRHVASQHLLLHYWLCQEGACAKLTNNPSGSSSSPGSRSRSRGGRAASSTVAATAGPSFGPPLPNGAIFNRKDLYTQHLRRMHTPPNIKKQAKQQQPRKTNNTNTTPDWEAHLRVLASRAMQDRCALPTYMRCPSLGCEFEFRGPDAWDQRMEHVGRHLERAAAGDDPRVEFGGPHDPTLIDWASRADVAVIRRNASNRWELNNPLRPTAKFTSTGEMVLTMPSVPAGLSAVKEEEEDEIIVENLFRDDDEDEHDFDLDAEGEEDDDI